MTIFKKRQELFFENAFLKICLILLYCLFLGIYFVNHGGEGNYLFSFLQIHKNGGSFFIELFANINWFLFYFISLILPLAYFQNTLFQQSVFETIRKSHKRKSFIEFVFSITLYSCLFVGVNVVVSLLVGNKVLSLQAFGIQFLVLSLTISMLVLLQVAISFFIEGFTGLFISLGLVLLCFYYDNMALIIPTKGFSQAYLEKIISTNSLWVVTFLCAIWILYKKKELI